MWYGSPIKPSPHPSPTALALSRVLSLSLKDCMGLSCCSTEPKQSIPHLQPQPCQDITSSMFILIEASCGEGAGYWKAPGIAAGLNQSRLWDSRILVFCNVGPWVTRFYISSCFGQAHSCFQSLFSINIIMYRYLWNRPCIFGTSILNSPNLCLVLSSDFHLLNFP